MYIKDDKNNKEYKLKYNHVTQGLVILLFSH